MDMKYGLPGPASAIQHKTKSRLDQTVFAGQTICNCKDRADEFMVRWSYFENSGKMFFGNDQQVDGGLGVDVLDRK